MKRGLLLTSIIALTGNLSAVENEAFSLSKSCENYLKLAQDNNINVIKILAALEKIKNFNESTIGFNSDYKKLEKNMQNLIRLYGTWVIAREIGLEKKMLEDIKELGGNMRDVNHLTQVFPKYNDIIKEKLENDSSLQKKWQVKSIQGIRKEFKILLKSKITN